MSGASGQGGLARAEPHHSQVTNITHTAKTGQKSLRKSALKAQISLSDALDSDVDVVVTVSCGLMPAKLGGNVLAVATGSLVSAVTGFTALCPITRGASSQAQAGPAQPGPAPGNMPSVFPSCTPSSLHRVCREYNLLQFSKNSLRIEFCNKDFLNILNCSVVIEPMTFLNFVMTPTLVNMLQQQLRCYINLWLSNSLFDQ